MIHIIAAVTREWGIGRDNTLPFHLPGDLRHFKALTLGQTVVMGRKTFESLPNGALPNRRNIVLTRDPKFHADRVEVLHNVDDILHLQDPHVWVIGGGELYKQILPWAEVCHITAVDAAPPCDTFFPNLDDQINWYRVLRSEPVFENGLVYTFDVWRHFVHAPCID